MSKGIIPLDKIKVAAPCPAEWRFMYGDGRVRFCGQCNLNVYNLSGMSKEEAEDLIRRTEGRLCVRFYRRKDGTVLTKNCPVGLRAIKDRLANTRSHLMAAVLSLFAYCGILIWHRSEMNQIEGTLYRSRAYSTETERMSMGVIACPIPETPSVERSESFVRNEAIFKVTPVFHSDLFKQVKQAVVVVKVFITEDGEVDEAELVRGPAILKELAEEAARRWKFEPILVKGDPVRVESTLTFHFGR